MPFYVYKAKDDKKGCKICKSGFEVMQSINDAPLGKCENCKAELRKVYMPFSFGKTEASLDSRAKNCGFHKLKKVDKGKYEKLY